jgi:hypothetical protein
MMLYIILLVSSTIELKAQSMYLHEGFELGRKPDNWTEEAVNGGVPWRYRNGGYNPADPNLLTPPAKYDLFRNPDRAKAGTYNSWFFTQGFGREQTKLITPAMDFSFAVSPTLSFWLTICEWRVPTGVNNDILRVYYKVGYKGAWRLLQTYNFVQNEWRDFQLNLPSEALQKDVYVAFEGLSRWGMGICLDEVKVEETGSQAKKLIEATTEAATTDIIPNGTANNPILCSRLKVTGNTGSAILGNVKVNAVATKLTDITRVKLYATQDPEFNTSTPIADGVLSGSSVVLTPNYSLPTGYSYLWVTYDIAADAKSGNTVDAEIPASGLTVNGATFANAAINSGGKRVIKQNLFFDDFESNKGWVLTGDFEIAAPMGKAGAFGNPDPSNAVSGSKVLGNDLTKDGVYDANIPSSAPYTATSPSFDALFYKGLVLNFKRWLNVDMYDTVKIQATKDNGVTWKTLWKNTDYALDDEWISYSVAFPAEFDRAHNIKLRVTLSYTNENREFTGWNIDDVSVTGNFMEKDLAMAEIVSPTSTCGSSGTSQPITLKVRNAGSKEAIAPIPVKITINGSTTIDDNITQNIAPGAEATVTLSKTFPAGLYGDLKVMAKTLLPEDEDNVNDTTSVNVHISKTYQTPYSTNFDASPDDWSKTGYNWMHGVSTAPNISGENSSDKMWITNLNGNYDNNAKATLTSPCFDIVGIEKPMLEFKANYITELGKDGVTLSYSTDNGKTWQLVGNNSDGWDALWGWNKQSAIASASGNVGFTGNSNGWVTFSHLLPASLNGATGVKFRFEFTSDAQNNLYSGFGLNGFTIKEAPDDFGLPVIVKPVTLTGAETCGGFTDKENIIFKLQNCGIKKAKAGAAIKVTFKSEYAKTAIATISRTEEFEETYTLPNDLAVGDVVQFTTTKTIDMNRGGFYNITVTNIDDPDNFYQKNNDKKVQQVEVKKPIVDLGPTVILGNPYPSDPAFPDDHNFDITGYASGFNYNIKWEKKIGEGAWTTLPNNGYTQSITKTEFASPNNKIAFKVTLTEKTSPYCSVSSVADVYKLNPDIAVTKLISPANDCSLGKTQAITVQVTNKGQAIDVVKAGTEVTLQLKYKGTLQPVHKFTTTKDMAAGESFEYTFPETFDMSAKGIYAIEASATIPYDINPSDNLTTTAESFGFPAFTLTPQTQTINALEFTYDADPALAFKSYEWYDLSTLKTNKVSFPGPADGKIWCTVTDNNGCSTKSEATITFAVKDVAIKSINNIKTDCTHEPTMKPALTIENKGNVTIPSGTPIPFEIDKSGTKSSETYTLAANLAPGATADIILNNPIDLSAKGSYNVSITASLNGDQVADNNKQSTSIETYGLPESNLPPVVTTKDPEVTLDAGAGFSEYKWSTSDFSQSILVTKDGKYDVKITDANKCYKIFSSQVSFIRNDLKIELTSTYGTGSTVCSGTTEYPVTVKITNTGNDTPKAGSKIPVTFKVGSEQINEDITLAADLVPNASISYTFTQKAVFATAGTTSVSAMTTIDDVDLTNNFTAVVSVTVNQTPTVSLGDDVTSIESSYTITPIITPDLATNTYLWSNAATTKALKATSSGTYKLTVTNQGCSASDEVVVTFNRQDISMLSIDSPTVFCASTESRDVTVTVRNVGAENIAAGTDLSLSYASGSTSATEKKVLTEGLAIGKTISYTFSQKLTSLTANDYFSATVSYAGDGVASNNTLSNITVHALPSFTLVNPIVSNATQVDIAGPVGMSKYAWSTGAATQNVTATTDGSYTLTVTDANGCSYAQSTQVIFSPDIELTAVANGTLCQNATAEPLTVTITNKSGKTLTKDTPLAFSGTIDGVSFTDSKPLSADLAPQASASVTLSSSLKRESEGQYPVSITIDTLTGEQNSSNNKLDATVTVNPSPSFTLPADIISSGSSEVIDGPAGMASYAWTRDGVAVSQEKTITVTLSGTYTLKVTNSKGCSSEKSIKVQFKGGDLALQSIVNNEKMCQSGRAVFLSLVIANNGDTPIAKGESITITVKSDGTVKTENFMLTEDLLPKATAAITLTTATGLNAATVGKTIVAEVSVSYQYDVNPNNPSVSKTFTVVANPTFSVDIKTATDKSQATLTANNANLSYSWSTGAATKDVTVYENSLYKVTGTNADGCSLIKEVAIDYLTPKATNFIMVYPIVDQTKCYNGTKKAFVVKLVNESQNSKVPAGTSVKVTCTYQITKTDGTKVEYKFSGTTTLTEALATGQSASYQFDNMQSNGKQVENMIEELAGKHTITGSTEANAIQSTVKTTQFEIYPIPTVNLGNDVIYRPLPGVLSVNLPSDYTFEWSTGQNTSSIIINTEGSYWVKVTSKNQCWAADTVEVKRGAEEQKLQLSIFPNPASSQVSIAASINTDSEITVDIYTSHGALLSSMVLNADNIAKLSNYDVSHLESGSYPVVARTKDKKVAKLLIIAR